MRVNGNVRPYDYLDMLERVSILLFHGENIITLREYCYSIRSWQTELPCGLIDSGETPDQAAVRKLKEGQDMINEFHSENRKSPGADMAGRYAVSGRFFRVSEFVYFVE